MPDQPVTAQPDLPLPNDAFDGGIIIASVWQRDEEPPLTATLMILRPQKPHYEIADVEWIHGAWIILQAKREMNINPATETYAQHGGDY